jgi:hypothetical protein
LARLAGIAPGDGILDNSVYLPSEVGIQRGAGNCGRRCADLGAIRTRAETVRAIESPADNAKPSRDRTSPVIGFLRVTVRLLVSIMIFSRQIRRLPNEVTLMFHPRDLEVAAAKKFSGLRAESPIQMDLADAAESLGDEECAE